MPIVSLPTGAHVDAIGILDSTLYFGGYFTTVNGVARRNLAAVDTATGNLITHWNPNAISIVYSIAISGATIYVGGTFSNIGGVTRYNFAAIDELGNVTNWAPNPVGGGNNQVFAIDTWHDSVAIAGNFEDVFYDNGYQYRPNLIVMTDETMQFRIHLSKEGNGTIDPPGNEVGNVYKYYDESQSFTFTPDQGYIIDRIEIDGVSQGRITSYTFSNIQKNYELAAYFIQRTNTPPMLIGVPTSATIDEMVLYTFDAYATDPESPPQTLSFSLVDAPEGGSIDPSTGVFTWTPTETQGGSTYTFQVIITDGTDFTESTVILTVNEVNINPTVTGVPPTVSADEMSVITFDANATDPDAPTQTLIFSLVDAPDGAVIDPSTGVFTWTPTEAQGPATYSFNIRVSDGVGHTEMPIEITVNEVNLPPILTDVPSEITADEMTLITFDASAADMDIPVQPLVFSLEDAPEGAVIDPMSGVFTWTPTEVQGPGEYSFKVKVNDGVASVESPITITVNEVNIPPILTDVPSEIIADEMTLITFDANSSDSDIPIQTLTFSMFNAPEGAVIDPASGVFTWTSTEVQGPGIYDFKVRVSDGVDYTETSISITLNEVNVPPTLTDVPPTIIADEITMIMFDANANDPDVPVQSLSFSMLDAPDGATIDPWSGIFNWIPTEVQGPGTYSFVVRVSDSVSITESPIDITVNEVNLPPILGEITAPIDPTQVNNTINASADFTDLDIPIGTHTAVWNWGDNTTSEGTIVYSGSTGSVSGSHAYTSAGVYVITLTVTDNGGATAQAVFYYIVVYDPTGGFVTGGGWIMSPAGAYRPNTSLTGKATFGFVSKYLKGANVPTGNTEFQFKTGNVNFKSTQYEWLVVAGAKAQYKGDGTINGSGYYGFMLTSIDGQINGGGGVDKFRIKIWDKNDGDAIVYDNQFGEDDTSSVATVLGGGSIVIHKSNPGAAAKNQEGIVENVAMPMEYALHQNYPNPFNPTTKIRYDLPQYSRVSLKVYNLLGQEVMILVDETQDAGFKSVSWDASDYPSGVYIYKLSAEAEGNIFVDVKKVVLMK